MEKNAWHERLQLLRGWLLGREKNKSQLPDLATAIAAAREEWLTAQRFFECVSEPDLVDQAIYSIEAAERKYMYLLRLAKTKELSSLLQ
ncbi:MAG: YaaL family protein [Firmicutes bacterium]|nr:YaaL family protein [Bacillota bacterium]